MKQKTNLSLTPETIAWLEQLGGERGKSRVVESLVAAAMDQDGVDDELVFEVRVRLKD